jgi:hypothetical protein
VSTMRVDYGSKWHLRSLLARHSGCLEQTVIAALSADGVTSASWIDWHPSYSEPETPELRGVDFLTTGSLTFTEWKRWWPRTGNVQNWDAVGTLHHAEGKCEWLLFEAKANLEEVHVHCKAKAHGGLPLIKSRLLETQLACGITETRDWTKEFYQYANRLALLHFLIGKHVLARIMFLYFIGDTGNSGRDCPASREPWDMKLRELKRYLGLTGRSELEKRVHHVFFDVDRPQQIHKKMNAHHPVVRWNGSPKLLSGELRVPVTDSQKEGLHNG